MRKEVPAVCSRPRPLPLAIGLALLSLAPASHADWKFTPAVDVRETYTDNVALRAAAQANWVTELTPGMSLDYKGPSVQLRSAYRKHFYEYSDRQVGGTQANSQEMSTDLKAKLLRETLLLDASASIAQREASAFGPLLQGTGNNFAAGNSNEVKTVRVSPYLVHRFGSVANAELRYTRDRVSSNNANLNAINGDTVAFNVSSGTAFRQFGWSMQANQEKQHSNANAGNSTGTIYNLSLRWLPIDTLTFTLTGGHDNYDYQALGGANGGASWSLGLKWVPSGRTTVQASAGKRYYGNSYSLQALHRTRMSVWSMNYNDAVTNTRSQFLLPSAVDTFSLLDRMFSATIPDAATRRQAVEAYIQSTGLPPSLANSINYFSNRYQLQKQFQAAGAFNLPHMTFVLSLQDTRRRGLSIADVDGGLLGSTTKTLNDSTRQSGINGTLNWRLSARTGLIASADYTQVHSVSANRTDNNKTMRIGITHQMQPKLRASLDLRRIEGGAAPATFTENAIAASLNKQF